MIPNIQMRHILRFSSMVTKTKNRHLSMNVKIFKFTVPFILSIKIILCKRVNLIIHKKKKNEIKDINMLVNE
jgi:hypothetical protein